MTAESIPRVRDLCTAPTHWPKPASVSTNAEDPFNSTGVTRSCSGCKYPANLTKPNSPGPRVLSLLAPGVHPQSLLLSTTRATVEGGGSPRRQTEEGLKSTDVWSLCASPQLLGFLETRLWHLTNLLRRLHSSTHGSTDSPNCTRSFQLDRIPNLSKKKFFLFYFFFLQREPAPQKSHVLCLGWNIAL